MSHRRPGVKTSGEHCPQRSARNAVHSGGFDAPRRLRPRTMANPDPLVLRVRSPDCEDRVTVVVPTSHRRLACVVAHMYPTPPPIEPEPPQLPRFLGRFALPYGMGLGTLCYAIG